MSSVFRVQDPKDSMIVIDLREPILTEVELIEMAYPFKRFLVEETRSETHPEPHNSSQAKFIEGIRSIKGLRRVQIWPYRITLHLASSHTSTEVLKPVVQLIAESWPEAQITGYDYQGTNPLGTVVAELVSVPTYRELCASLRNPAIKLSFEARWPRDPEQPVWIKDFRPKKLVRLHDERLIFSSDYSCFITESQARKAFFGLSTDQVVSNAKLVIDYSHQRATLCVASSKK